MEMELATLAEMLGGHLSDPARSTVKVSSVRSLDAAGRGDLAFLWAESYAAAARTSGAEAIICRTAIEGQTCILVDDPEAAMLQLLRMVYASRHPTRDGGVDPAAIVSAEAELGESVFVGPGAVIEAGAEVGARTMICAGAYVGRRVKIGEDCAVHPNATILDLCELGNRVTIWSGAVIGKDGFGFLQRDGGHVRIPQIGTVIIEDDVEIGALSTVARGAMDDTVVHKGVIVDDHCHIAHGCEIGEHSVLVGRTAMGGSVKVGKRCFFLQDAAVSTGLTVGEGAIVGSNARVLYKNVEPGETVQRPGITYPSFTAKRIEASLARLPEMRLRLKQLERRIEALDREAENELPAT
jgi:UDP-3-O-[3-hydroxymyristoyl] glucosamine N-acyltransferase